MTVLRRSVHSRRRELFTKQLAIRNQQIHASRFLSCGCSRPLSRKRRRLSSSTSRASHTLSDTFAEEEDIPPAAKVEQQHKLQHSDMHNSPLQRLLKMPTLFDPVRTPRLPIVLCHGLFGFDTVGISLLPKYHYRYWDAVLRILKDQLDAEVIVTAVPAAGSIKQRAEALHQTLYKEMRGREFNIIAHSMGGLDARWLLSHIRPTSYRPRSLLTMSTPHRGSPFMAWCRDNIGVGSITGLQESSDQIKLPYSLEKPIFGSGSDTITGALPAWGSALSSYMLKFLDNPAYSNLTPAYLANVFNPSTLNTDDVKYYSVAARTQKLDVWHPLWLPKLILDASDAKRAKELGQAASLGNDGLVPVESAVWGELLGIVESCEHFALRGAGGFRSPTSSPVEPSSSIATQDASKAATEQQTTSSWALNELYENIDALKTATVGEASESKAQPSEGWANWITKRIPSFNQDGKVTKQRNPGFQSLQEALRKSDTGEPLRFSTKSKPPSGKYNLEALYLALTRKLYDDGL